MDTNVNHNTSVYPYYRSSVRGVSTVEGGYVEVLVECSFIDHFDLVGT